MKRVVLALVAALSVSSCQKEGCLSGDPACVVPPPCQKVTFTCEATALSIDTITSSTQRPGGLDALGAKGDVKLSNDLVDVVIAGLGNQNYLDPNGGSILDLGPHGQSKDDVNGILQVVGILPRDAAYYTELKIIDERPARVAVQVKGTLDGIPSVAVVTRYELTPCDPGVRIRTEIVNGSNDVETWALVDGFYWSGRESLPFAPGPGRGFLWDSFGLTTIDGAFHEFPFVAAAGHSGDEQISAISLASCTEPTLEGFMSDQISAAGLKRQIVPPRGSLVNERFIAVADSKGVAGAIDLALEVRKQVLGEQYVTLTGSVERLSGDNTFGDEREASVLISEGRLTDDVTARIPWTQLVPAADGTFTARVPAGKSYVVEAHAFGHKQVEREYADVSADLTLEPLVLPGTTTLTFEVKDKVTHTGIDAELFLAPADDADDAALEGSLHGRFATCAPWLGSPAGASPACNRVLVKDGAATVEVPAGRFDVYAFHGPFWSIAKQTVDATQAQTVSLELTALPDLVPPGAVSADFHVHGSASFDSSIPPYDRVLALAASNLDVIIATDHEVATDYAAMIDALGLTSRLTSVVGVETTGHIPFLMVPGYGFPLVIGHYIGWPIAFDPSLPRNGAPFDERIEPGELFTRFKPLFTDEGVLQLNHPWADPEFGRDLGFPRAIFMDLRNDLPTGDDGTRMGVYVRTPDGAQYANHAHDAQEVMNGTDNGLFLQYRAFWHYVLNQGQVKVGTANSDSHSLTDNTVGMPRNLVFTSTHGGTGFDVAAFDRDVKEGHTIGTNGPVIVAALKSGADSFPSSVREVHPVAADATLEVTVKTAPWIPVDEVRFVVNGKVVKTEPVTATFDQPFAEAAVTAWQGSASVSELLDGVTGDAWIVVEAGSSLPLAGDLGGGLDNEPDGVPDTTDNNHDGKVDAADLGEGKKIGPLEDPPDPPRGARGYEYGLITGGSSSAFTNPFLIDRNADAKFNAPGVKGGRP